MNELAPIALFLYNRPDHSKRTLDALALNIEAKDSDLIIYCDAAKANASKEQVERINKVREIANAETRFKSVNVIVQKENKGLSASIVSGVTEVLDKYGKIIVVEDDLIVSQDFLSFMNTSLIKYENNPEVVCITGYVYPIKKQFSEAFFLKGADCWTWATWKNKWSLFNQDAVQLKNELIAKDLVREFNFNNSYPYMQMLEDKINGKNQSWAILWYASAFLANKYCLYPPHSMVHNIGNDGSGTHALKETSIYKVDIKESTKIIFPNTVEENMVARKQFELFFNSAKPSLIDRAKNKIKRVIKRVLKTQPVYGWSGDFASWEKAQKKCSGYDNSIIVNKVKDAVLKVKKGEAKFERDSVLFDEIYFFEPIVNALNSSVKDNKLHVCDFGGSLGSSYFQFKEQFKNLTELKWTVVEQEHFVEIGNKEIAYENLSFQKTIDEALKVQTKQLLLLFSVLQYIPNAHELIKKLISYKFEYIIIDRTAFIERPNDRIAIQVVPPDIYEASYPCWFFNENNFLNLFLKDYDLLNSFVDEIPEPMLLGAEKVSWKGYYLKRKDV